jgi:hypothetical protein
LYVDNGDQRFSIASQEVDMSATRDAFLASRVSRVILAVTAVMSLGAAVAAAPAAPPSQNMVASPVEKARLDPGEQVQGVRPLAQGAGIRVGRAYDAEDEDCTLIITQTPDANGHMRVTRRIACAQ